MASETNGVTGEQVVYQYDSLNRLIKAASSTEGQSFVYDGFGNLVQKNATAGTAPTVLMTVDPTTNRITSMGGSSTYSYDNNGNVLLGPTVNTYVALAYDVRNRIVTNSEPQNPVSGTAATFSYAYDSSNRRIWKGWMTTSQNEVYYLYGADGRQIASYALTITTSGGRQHLALNLVQQHVYFAGVDIYNNPQDRLGSQPMANFYAYGEEKSVTANEAFKFATYWRDGESGLDYAVNRYYASSMGTFLSPDPADSSMDPKNPQSFNRYAYAMGDPVNSKDPTGLDDAGGPACLDPAYADSHAECQQPGSPYCLGDPSDPSCGGYGPVRVLGGSSGGGSAAPTQRCPTRSCWVGHCCPRGIWR